MWFLRMAGDPGDRFQGLMDRFEVILAGIETIAGDDEI